MGFLDRLNTGLSIIWKALGLIILAAIILYVSLSIWGNISIGNMEKGLALPKESKAQYEILLTTTGEKFLTNNYESSGPGQYILNGFYSLEQNKWRYHKDSITLDEEYFGKILVKRR